jgi:hypothetical protein
MYTGRQCPAAQNNVTGMSVACAPRAEDMRARSVNDVGDECNKKREWEGEREETL